MTTITSRLLTACNRKVCQKAAYKIWLAKKVELELKKTVGLFVAANANLGKIKLEGSPKTAKCTAYPSQRQKKQILQKVQRHI